jgi:hypothetical protein
MVSDTMRLEARPVLWAWPVSTAASARLARTGTTLVLLACVYAAMAQGAFYPGQLRLATVFVLAGLAVTLIATGVSRLDLGAPTIAAVGLGAWYLVAGVLAHDVGGAIPAIELLAALAATVVVMRRADEIERRGMLAGVIAVGSVLALVGWQGVAWRQVPRALEDGGLWRAASTITYANATAGLLAALAVLALGWIAENRQERLLLAAGSYTLLVGLFATASRAGVIAFALGLGWLTVGSRGRVLLRAWPVVLGALLSTATLMPSMVASHSPRPFLAVCGLVAGLAVAIAQPRVAGTLVGVTAVALLVVPGVRTSVTSSLHQVRRDRATLSSPDRSNEQRAALRLAHDHPVAGVGPGRVDLTWDVANPQPTTMHEAYAHNEFLQTVDEAGIPGLVLLLAGLGAVALAIRRARHVVAINATAGAVAALVALAAHSAFDFLWHVPLIPLIAAVIVGTLLPQPSATTTHGRVHQ